MDEDEYFKAEQHVKIYLAWDDDRGKWRVDGVTMDGEPLDSDHAAAYCDVPDPTPAQREVLDRASLAVLPTGHEVTAMLVDYMADQAAEAARRPFTPQPREEG